MSEVDVLKITNEDAAFILGKGGRTSTRRASVSFVAVLKLPESLCRRRREDCACFRC